MEFSDRDLFYQNGRCVSRFKPFQTAYDQLVRNGHRSVTNIFRVTDRRSLVDIFLVVGEQPDATNARGKNTQSGQVLHSQIPTKQQMLWGE